jgi:hypothetical protein
VPLVYRTARFFVYGFALFSGIYLILDLSHPADKGWEPFGLLFALKMGVIGGASLVGTCIALSMTYWVFRVLLERPDD